VQRDRQSNGIGDHLDQGGAGAGERVDQRRAHTVRLGDTPRPDIDGPDHGGEIDRGQLDTGVGKPRPSISSLTIPRHELLRPKHELLKTLGSRSHQTSLRGGEIKPELAIVRSTISS